MKSIYYNFIFSFNIYFKILINLFFFLLLFANNIKDKKNKIRFIYCNTPIHKNYGDEAIFISTRQFLNFYFPQNEKIIVNVHEVFNMMKLIKHFINKNDILIINGGGYFGLYDHIIELQANIVKNFPNNYIIIFPSSIYNNPDKKLLYLI
jgi:exopolysaccharide biosynthesis predicted pyruvyltransferase EpsI